MKWTKEEVELIEKYFKSSITELLLFNKILAINPNRTYGAILRKIYEYKENGWGKKNYLKKLRVGYLDIEATGLQGNFAHMLSLFIKVQGQKKYYSSIIMKKEIFDGDFDKRLVKELLVAFEHFDVLYTHYGSDYRFDLPFIRTRVYRHKLEKMLPQFMEKFILDTFSIAKAKLKLHSNRLDSIADALGITNIKKTPLSPSIWEMGKVGQPKALEYIAKHNKHDVILLEAIHKKLSYVENPIVSRYKSI